MLIRPSCVTKYPFCNGSGINIGWLRFDDGFAFGTNLSKIDLGRVAGRGNIFARDDECVVWECVWECDEMDEWLVCWICVECVVGCGGGRGPGCCGGKGIGDCGGARVCGWINGGGKGFVDSKSGICGAFGVDVDVFGANGAPAVDVDVFGANVFGIGLRGGNDAPAVAVNVFGLGLPGVNGAPLISLGLSTVVVDVDVNGGINPVIGVDNNALMWFENVRRSRFFLDFLFFLWIHLDLMFGDDDGSFFLGITMMMLSNWNGLQSGRVEEWWKGLKCFLVK